ncbi:helix-turn-helix transcriptional regulator [Solibacillus sp. FSL H8-0538]|uniref:helix-turn-helix transcriptional regulator n=1 Tax=Solibacillus sp. FSL H8-0538 TaxID=2921400 RepID=UPI0030F8AE05
MQIYEISLTPSLQEARKHGSPEFPLACYRTDVRKNIHGHIPLHWHEEIQFMLVVEGEVALQINGRPCLLKEGDGLFINSGALHITRAVEHNRSVYICINVGKELLAPAPLQLKFVIPLIHSATAYVHWEKSAEHMVQLQRITQIYTLYEQCTELHMLEIAQLVQQCWQYVVHSEQPAEKVLHIQPNDRMKAMLLFIQAHAHEKILLEEIAQAGHISRAECCRYFRKWLQQTPIQYVTAYRLDQSIRLLQHSELSVTEIALQVGFGSTSYFIEKFAAQYEQTPHQFRKNLVDHIK